MEADQRLSGRLLFAQRVVYLMAFILFLPIYLDCSIFFRIFAHKKGGTGSTSPIILILLLVNCCTIC